MPDVYTNVESWLKYEKEKPLLLAWMEEAAFQQMFKSNGTTFFACHHKSVVKHKQKGRDYEFHSLCCTSPRQQENKGSVELWEGNYNL